VDARGGLSYRITKKVLTGCDLQAKWHRSGKAHGTALESG